MKEIEDLGKITDPEWRLANLYHIRNKKGQKQLLIPNATQSHIYEHGIKKSRYNMILKGRQQGVSTFFLMYYLNKVLYTENYTAAIISHDRESIEKLFRPIRYAYESIPNSLKPRLDKGGGSKYAFYFPELKSRIYVALEVRSESVNSLHVSEYGFMPKSRYNASVDAVPVDSGEISIESTPNGINHFQEDWVNPEFPYIKHFFPWFFHKENVFPRSMPITKTSEEELFCKKARSEYGIGITNKQILWRRFKIDQTNKESFMQEHPEDDKTCFLTSGNSVFDLIALDKKTSTLKKPIEEDGHLKILHLPETGGNYVIGCDTAEGVGGDNSAAVLYCPTTKKVMAQIHGQLPPKILAEELSSLAERYTTHKGMVTIAVERNNHGHAVLLWLESHCKYPFIYEDDDGRAGWKTNSMSRPIMLDEFIDAVNNDLIEVGTQEILSECMTLINNNGKIEAVEKKHDDLVVAYAIALQASKKSKHYLMDWINNM